MLYKLKIQVNRLDKKLLCLCFFLSLLFFGINWSIEYATDTYATFEETGTWQWMLYENGRIFSALIYYLIECFGISNGYIYKLSWLTAIFFLTAGVYLLSQLLLTYQKNVTLCVLISFLTIANFYIIEYFLFIEKGLFLFAIFLCVVSCCLTVEYLKTGHKYLLFYVLLSLLAAVFIYQIIPGLYIILCLPFLIRHSLDGKQFLKYNLMLALLYAVPLLIAFLLVRFVFGSSRLSSSDNLFTTIRTVLGYIVDISTADWFHVPGKLSVTVMAFIALTAILLSVNTSPKRLIVFWLGWFYILAAVTFVAFFPCFSGISTSYLPRTLYPYASLPGVLFIYLLIDNVRIGKRLINYWLIPITVLFLFLQYTIFQSVFIERYKCNQADLYYAQIIYAQINDYEQATGNIIDTITFYRDASTAWNEPAYSKSGLMTRAQAVGWGNLNSINLYLDTQYQKGEPLPEYESHFQQYNWDIWSEEQMIFEGSVLHLCIY